MLPFHALYIYCMLTIAITASRVPWIC